MIVLKTISEFTKLNLLAQTSVAWYFVLFSIFIVARRIFEGDIDLMNWNTGHILFIHRENASLLNVQKWDLILFRETLKLS